MKSHLITALWLLAGLSAGVAAAAYIAKKNAAPIA